MSDTRFIQLVTFQLKDGVSETQLLQASDAFQVGFASQQPGIQGRFLLRSRQGGYADLVFFESAEHAGRIASAEATSEPFRALLQLLAPPEPNRPTAGIASFEQLKAYE